MCRIWSGTGVLFSLEGFASTQVGCNHLWWGPSRNPRRAIVSQQTNAICCPGFCSCGGHCLWRVWRPDVFVPRHWGIFLFTILTAWNLLLPRIIWDSSLLSHVAVSFSSSGSLFIYEFVRFLLVWCWQAGLRWGGFSNVWGISICHPHSTSQAWRLCEGESSFFMYV